MKHISKYTTTKKLKKLRMLSEWYKYPFRTHYSTFTHKGEEHGPTMWMAYIDLCLQFRKNGHVLSEENVVYLNKIWKALKTYHSMLDEIEIHLKDQKKTMGP